MKVIVTHTNADFDSLSSMVAAKKLYPDALLILPASREKSLRNFLINSTLYLFDFLEEKEIDLEKVETLILVDTRQRSRIGEFSKILSRKDLKIHIYDHHPPSKDDIEGEINVIKNTGATCSILVLLIKEKELEISPAEATVMMLGIYEETGNFTYPSTTIEDFEAASFLLSKGADLNIVSNFLVKELTPEDISVLNELMDNLKGFFIEDLEVHFTEATLPSYAPDLASLVQRLRDIKNLNVLFAIFPMGEKILVIGRSRVPEVDVGYILSFFGGGGHKEAASATVKDLTIFELKERLLEYLKNTIKPSLKAKDIMFFPVKTIEASCPIEQAKDLMVKFNINALPVLQDGVVTGIITRQIAEKALFHGFKEVPVRDYMIADIKTVEEEDSITKVKDIIIGHNQRLLPVVRGEKLVGAITRTDLLKVIESEIGKFSPSEEETKGLYSKKNLKRMMEEKIDRRIIDRLKEIGKIADLLSYRAFVVGGFVRDLILGIENMDIDIVVEGDGIKFAEELGKFFNLKIKPYQAFGTAKLQFEDGLRMDVATARFEYYRKPASPPVVEYASLKLDLLRRDFTINTLAISLNSKNFGELIDFFGGLRDIKEKMIRVLHSMSFVEDPTRIFRAIRFSERFGFRISKYTMNLLKNARDLSLLSHLKGKRIWTELSLILSEERPEAILKGLKDLDLLRYVFEDLRFDREKETLFKGMRDVYKGYEILFRADSIDKVRYYLFGLLDGMEIKKIKAFCDRMELGEKRKKKIIEEMEHMERFFSLIGDKNKKKSEIFELLRKISLEARLFIATKASGSEARTLVSEFLTRRDNFEPKITGKDLKKMGIKEGPIYRKIFEAIRNAKINGEIKTETEEIELVKRIMEKAND